VLLAPLVLFALLAELQAAPATGRLVMVEAVGRAATAGEQMGDKKTQK
jgi:hypothetical protein